MDGILIIFVLWGLFFLAVYFDGRSPRVEEPSLIDAELAMILWTLDDELDM